MKHYIIHHPGNVERRVKLEEHLKEKGITNVEWVTTFSKEEVAPLKSINNYTPLGYISCNMKHHDALDRMIKDGIQEAIIFEDDVVISDIYDESKIPRNFPYVKLGRGANDMLIELSTEPRIIGNNGGAEACYVTIDFARFYNSNISLKWTIETEQHAFLLMYKIPLVCVPMCWQPYECAVHEDMNYPLSWMDFITEYPSYKKYTYKELKDMCIK
jgi:hypothetical protein